MKGITVHTYNVLIFYHRRVAAMSVAARVADEMGCKLGKYNIWKSNLSFFLWILCANFYV